MGIESLFLCSQQSTIFLVNVGVVRHGTQSSTQLLEKAKFIIKHTIQKKVHSSTLCHYIKTNMYH